MPSPGLNALVTAVSDGFAEVTAAINANQSNVDLTGLTTQIQRMADALYTVGGTSVADVAEQGNTQVASVIGSDTAGDNRVRTDPNVP